MALAVNTKHVSGLMIPAPSPSSTTDCLVVSGDNSVADVLSVLLDEYVT